MDQLLLGFIEALPRCAVSEKGYTYETGPEALDDEQNYEDDYVVYCQGSHHAEADGSPNMSAANMVSGLMTVSH